MQEGGEASGALSTSSLDCGHRLGNFHNYYAFHKTSARVKPLVSEYAWIDESSSNTFSDSIKLSSEVGKKSILDYIVNQYRNRKCDNIKKRKTTDDELGSFTPTFFFCDLGCNEGDLTFSLAYEIASRLNRRKEGQQVEDYSSTNKKVSIVRVLGCDIDPVLIDRATKKFVNFEQNSAPDVSYNVHVSQDPALIRCKFSVCNLSDQTSFEENLNKFWESSKSINSLPRFHLTTIFSTTMWIHIHHGDSGLKKFLERACAVSQMILVEPQPSRCYRTVNERLRKRNRPEVDLSSLFMRPNIEQEIDKVIMNCDFRRVEIKISSKYDSKQNSGQGARSTSWQRSLRLYERAI